MCFLNAWFAVGCLFIARLCKPVKQHWKEFLKGNKRGSGWTMLLLFTHRAIKELKCWFCFTSFSNTWTLSSLVCVFVKDLERDIAFSLYSLHGTSVDCVRWGEVSFKWQSISNIIASLISKHLFQPLYWHCIFPCPVPHPAPDLGWLCPHKVSSLVDTGYINPRNFPEWLKQKKTQKNRSQVIQVTHVGCWPMW